jgi:hypothetical protein
LRQLPPLGSISERILLTLWVGGMWTVGYIAAPMLFQVLDDRQLAGVIAGELFSAIAYVGLVAGTLLLVASARSHGARWYAAWRVWVIAGMLLVVLVGEFGMHAQMAALLEAAADGSAPGAQFAALHRASSLLYLANSLLGLVLVIFGALPRGLESK